MSQFPHAERSYYEAAERCRLNESLCRDLEGRYLTRHAVMDFIRLNHMLRPSVENFEVEILIENNNDTCACVFGFHADLTYCLLSTCKSELDQSCKDSDPTDKNKQKNSTEIFNNQ